MKRRQFLAGQATVAALAAAAGLTVASTAVASSQSTSTSGILNVRDFGATGDGVTDDTSSVQQALSQLGVTARGALYFPAGTYRVSSELVVGFSGRLFGDGTSASIILATSPSQTILRNTHSGYLEISGLGFDSTVLKTAGAAIRIEGNVGGAAQQIRIHHCRIMNQFIGIDMANAGYWSISENYIGESVQFGIFVDNVQNYDAGDNIISGNVIQKTDLTPGTTGIMQVASGGTKVIGNKVLGFDRGFALSPRPGAEAVIDTQIVGNSIEDGNVGILLTTPHAATGGAQIVISSNQLANKQNGIVVMGAYNGLTIVGNQIACNHPNHIGIYLDSMSGAPGQIAVTGNQITGEFEAGTIGVYGGFLPHISLHANGVSGVASSYSNIAGRVTDATFAVATLPAAADGSIVYCSDGTMTTPVAAGGTGCIAKRINGIWVGN